MFLGDALHGRKQFGDPLFKCGGIHCLDGADSEPACLDHEFLKIGGQQLLSRLVTEDGGGHGEDLLAKLLNILTGKSGQFCCDALISRCARR